MEWIAIVLPAVILICGIIKAVVSRGTQVTSTGSSGWQSASTASGAKETGPMVYFANAKNKTADREYRFNYKQVNGSWRAYILHMPSLGSRDASGVVTHRLYDNGNPYVCWDRDVKSLEDMQTISKVWADNIQEYIATGKRFG